MGAEMIGYFLYVPQKTSGKLFKDHLNKLNKVFAPNSVKFMGKGKTSKKSPLDQLKELGVCVDDYADTLGLCQSEEEDEQAKVEETELLENIKDDIKSLKEFDILCMDYRDVTQSTIEVNGVFVDIYFAGEMSWGDEPSGYGYAQIKKLQQLGFGNAFDKEIKRPRFSVRWERTALWWLGVR